MIPATVAALPYLSIPGSSGDTKAPPAGMYAPQSHRLFTVPLQVVSAYARLPIATGERLWTTSLKRL
jgi:hypothetical protein